MARARHTYRWWPSYRADVAETNSRLLWGSIVGELLFAAVLNVPLVERTTGVPGSVAAGLIVGHLCCFAFSGLVLSPLARRSRTAFHAQVLVNLTYNLGISLAFVVVAGDPHTPWWMAPLIVAVVNGGAQEQEPSVGVLAIVVAAPLLTIPWFLAGSGESSWAVTGPVLCAGLSGLVYDLLSRTNALWRAQRAELRARIAGLERQRIARDLHDSLGSSLALFGLYGDLVERNAHRPEALRETASALRDASREGLADLRSLLDALTPGSADLGQLAASLERLGQQAAEASGAQVRVHAAEAPRGVVADGRLQLAAVRVFQEATRNALRHGRARQVVARLEARAGALELELQDDGCGFDAGASSSGRGLPGMRARAAELGGRCEVASAPGQGTRVSLTLPLAAGLDEGAR